MERRGVLARLAAMWPGGAPGAPLATNGFRGDIMIGAKLKIALLYDLWNEDPVAAAGKEEAAAAPAPKRRKKVKKVKKEKTDREEIFDALQKRGHQPSYSRFAGK